jgi:hypothetical protein
MKIPLIVGPTTRFQIRNNINNEKKKKKKIQQSASRMVHIIYVNINNENATPYQLHGVYAAC